MTVQETINDAVAEFGLASVLDACKESFNFYNDGHKRRKEFCEFAKSLLCILVSRLGAITAKHGYVPAKE